MCLFEKFFVFCDERERLLEDQLNVLNSKGTPCDIVARVVRVDDSHRLDQGLRLDKLQVLNNKVLRVKVESVKVEEFLQILAHRCHLASEAPQESRCHQYQTVRIQTS